MKRVTLVQCLYLALMGLIVILLAPSSARTQDYGAWVRLHGISYSSGRIPVLADLNNAAAVTGRNNSIIEGCVEHDLSSTACQPVLVGYQAIAHGTNPTAVAAGDMVRALANRQNIPFSGIPHPNIITREWTVADADGAQTGTALVDISAGTKIVVLYHKVACDTDNTADVDFRMAFDTDGTFAAAAVTGTNGIIDSQPGIPAGGGSTMAVPVTGGDAEDVRYSLEDPAGGACRGVLKYYTIES